MTDRFSKKQWKLMSKYAFLSLLAVLMVYPLLWMGGAAFKSNNEIFSQIGIFPSHWSFQAFREGWSIPGGLNFGLFFKNSLFLAVPTVFFTALSAVFIGYGFARFRIPFKKILLPLMISTLMLPNTVVIIPRYLLFNKLQWLDSFKPFVIPAILGAYPFFNFMMVQFFRGIPRELDESARMDGCHSLRTLFSILLPLCKPAIFSVIIFQTMWVWNDFFNTLIYISSVKKFPLSLGLRMTVGFTEKTSWNEVMAMSILSIAPLVILFFSAQKYFVEGIATKGLKG